MIKDLKPKEATAIINSLVSGVVPKIGIQHITVGRDKEVDAIIQSLNDVKNGHSLVKFWIGDFGSGKSFMLHLLNIVALKQKFVTSTADFTPEKRLYSSDRKAVSLYTSIIDNLSIQTKPEGGALETLLEKWIENSIITTAEENKIPLDKIRNEEYIDIIKNNIIKTTYNLTDSGGFDFGLVIQKYYEGYMTHNISLCKNAVKWLKGEYITKTEAKNDLGVRDIINDINFYDMIKNFCKLFVSIGYSGFMINLDEAINLYKISTAPVREKNYEKILTIYNDCFQGRISNLFINFAGTKEFLENERKGLFSYNALKTRLESNKYETEEIRDFSQPVIKILPLNENEIFVLLQKIKEIFNFNYSINIDINNDDIHSFMEHIYNQQGSEYLTPREIIRDFLNVLNILRQNPNVNKSSIIENTKVETNYNYSLDDEIEEI